MSPATRLQRSREICVTANRLSGGRMGASLLAAAEAATALVTSQWEPAPSHWEGCDFPVGASQIPLGNPTGSFSGGEWDFQRAARKASGRTGGAPRGREGGGSRGEAALAVSHSPARVGGAPLPCARHFLWGTFLYASFRVFYLLKQRFSWAPFSVSCAVLAPWRLLMIGRIGRKGRRAFAGHGHEVLGASRASEARAKRQRTHPLAR